MPAPAIPDEGDNNQQLPAVAFDGDNYLVVWADDRGVPNDWHIYGALVPTAGNPSLSEEGFQISTSTCNPDFLPSVAFGAGYYLVAWQDDTYENVYGRLVNALGERQGTSDIEICTYLGEGSLKYGAPSIAFDGTNFLVVWMDDQLDGTWWHLYGARVDPSTGQVVPADVHGRLIWSNSNSSDQWNPSVAFDGTNYLAVWYDDRSADGIYGVLVSKSLAVLQNPGEIPISITSYYQDYPRVAFDGTNYLVVWQNADNDALGARVRASDGYVVDQDDDVIPICTSVGRPPYPDVAYGGGDYYYVVWQEYNEVPINAYSFDINGCEISLGGVPTAYDDPISEEAYDEAFPAIACGPVDGKAMVVYQAVPGVFGEGEDEHDYGDLDRILARRAALTWEDDADVATVSIERPVASFLTEGSWPIPPMAQLTNNGAEARSFLATFTINNKNNEEVYSRTKTVLGLRPNTPRSEVFPPFDLSTEGSNLYTATCQTLLADDDDTDNNTKDTIFQGCDFIYFFDLGGGEFTSDNVNFWCRDIPDQEETPWELPPMDEHVWGYNLYGTYGTADNYLTSPEYTASHDVQAIAFQHSFDFESGADGGNFSYNYSTNGGEDWEGWQYPAPFAGPPYTENVTKLSGDGWSGNSGGWKQSVFTFANVTDGDSFRVRFHYASGASTPSRGWLIDELAGIGCDLYSGKAGAAGYIDTMHVWPNPTCGKTQVSYTLRKAGPVTVKLYDASGRLARQVPTNGFKKGPNMATLDATALARGVYFVKVEGASNFRTTKVIIE